MTMQNRRVMDLLREQIREATVCSREKLTILAKRKSLFDDKAVEIEELTYIIKQDINSLNKQIAQLQDFVRAKGCQSGRHLQTHSNTIVVSLQVGPWAGGGGEK